MPARKDLKKILLLGSGAIVIGQACEFDYSGVQAAKVLKEEGYDVVVVNPNPATVMTTPGIADTIYLEPLKIPYVEEIIRKERPDAVLPTMGGQTALNLLLELDDGGILEKWGVEVIGASAESIRLAEDRGRFKKAMEDIGLDVPNLSSSVRCRRPKSLPSGPACRWSYGPPSPSGAWAGPSLPHGGSSGRRWSGRFWRAP